MSRPRLARPSRISARGIELALTAAAAALLVTLLAALILSAFATPAGAGGNHEVCDRKPWKPECQTTTTTVEVPPTTVPETTTTTVEEQPTTTTTTQPTTTTTEPQRPGTPHPFTPAPLECFDSDGFRYLVDPYSYDECPTPLPPADQPAAPEPAAEMTVLPVTGLSPAVQGAVDVALVAAVVGVLLLAVELVDRRARRRNPD